MLVMNVCYGKTDFFFLLEVNTYLLWKLSRLLATHKKIDIFIMPYLVDKFDFLKKKNTQK